VNFINIQQPFVNKGSKRKTFYENITLLLVTTFYYKMRGDKQ